MSSSSLSARSDSLDVLAREQEISEENKHDYDFIEIRSESDCAHMFYHGKLHIKYNNESKLSTIFRFKQLSAEKAGILFSFKTEKFYL